MKKRRVAASALLAGLAIGSCPVVAGSVDLPLQIGGAYRVGVQSLSEAREASTIRQRHDFSCGSAALATLLTHHYGQPVVEADVFDAMYADGDHARISREGFSLLDMKRYLTSRGFEADGFEEPIERLLEAGLPAIVLIDAGGYHHFVVVKGLRDGRVLLGDPALGTRVMGLAAFRAAQVGQVLFVVLNHRDAAAFNVAEQWRSAPGAPLADAVGRAGLAGVVLPKLGPSDF